MMSVAGSALDAEIARVIFNRPVKKITTRYGRLKTVYADVDVDEPQEWHWFQAEIEQYSTRISDAWKVVERMRELGHTKWGVDGDGDQYAALFNSQRSGMTCEHSEFDSGCCCWEWVQETADTVPLAICRAALRALGREVPGA